MIICDDRNVLEDLQKVRNMTDEEFEEYIKFLKNEENKKEPLVTKEISLSSIEDNKIET